MEWTERRPHPARRVPDADPAATSSRSTAAVPVVCRPRVSAPRAGQRALRLRRGNAVLMADSAPPAPRLRL